MSGSTSPDGDELPVEVAELLSALLDGAVTDDERATADDWLARSAEARAEYESLAQVKAAVGGMGEVEVPFGFYDRMLRQGTPEPEVTSALDPGARRAPRGRRLLVAGGAALVGAAAALVVVGGRADEPVVRPPIEAVASGAGAEVRTLDGPQGPISLVRQEAGGVRWDELPEGLRLDQGGSEVWQDLTTADGEERVIVFRDGVVVTVFASSLDDEEAAVDELVDEAEAVIDAEPADERGNGILDRLRRGVEKLVDFVSPG